MLKASIALGALMVSLINAAPTSATASQISPERSISYGVPPQLAYLVEAANVPVIDGRDFPDYCAQFNGDILGAYNAKANAMMMCVQNFEGKPGLYAEVFAHESVHLAQDCRTGIENTQLNPGNTSYLSELWAQLPQRKKDGILKNYPADKHNVEVEAFYFEDKPALVAGGLLGACF